MNPSMDDQIVCLLVIAAVVVILLYRRRWRGSGTAYGTSRWLTERELRKAGMLAGDGLIVGRTFKGALIRLRDFCHVLICGSTGSGKGVGVFIPNLLTWFRTSIICFDTKGDLYETTGKRRAAKGQRIIRLAPLDGGEDHFNPLETIRADSPKLVDSARALAAALVVRQENEHEAHWNDKAVELIHAVLVLILLKFYPEDRNLNSVQEIICDRKLLRAAVKKLQEIGGIPARLGNKVEGFFEMESDELTKEGVGVISTATRHLSFLDSDLVAKAVSTSTFNPAELRQPGSTLFMQIGPDQLEAQSGLLRCWTTALVRAIGASGNEEDGEVLFLLDEASALNALPAVEEALVRGRSAGIRLVLGYQSFSQITDAFKNKPTLLFDNAGTLVHLGAASSYEGADRLSKTIGEWTQVVEQYGENESYSWQSGSGSQQGGQMSHGSSLNYSETGRPLLRADEILQQSNDTVIILQRGNFPILAQRVKWYQDPEFNPAVRKKVDSTRPWWLDLLTPIWRQPSRASVRVRLVAAAILALILWAMVNQANR
jgi:type IV secretion system protein VirD4